MFFRFTCVVLMVVTISLAGIALEKRSLDVRRQLTRQHFRGEVLLEQHARLRLRTEQLGSPQRLFESLRSRELELAEPARPATASPPASPLLLWRQGVPLRDEAQEE